MTIASGTRLGPYEIVSLLGKGGMGEVYDARDTRLARTVALKVLPSQFSSDSNRRARFEQEAKAISQLNHPNICALYDVGDADGRPYLVMEMLQGETLADRLLRGRIPFDQLLRIAMQMCDALDGAHRAGIVHRDLKPGNVMLTKSGAKLLDFGLAKPYQSNAADASASVETSTAIRPLTAEGAIVGTLQYMAPEQFEGAGADSRSDIFALGALLYEMATGRPAFAGSSRPSVMAAVLTGEPAPMSTERLAMPPLFEQVVTICLRKSPDDRWQSASDVGLVLRTIAADAAQPASAGSRERRLWRWALASLLLTVTVGSLFMLWRSNLRAPIRNPIRTSIVTPAEAAFNFLTVAGAPPEISPDGQKVVFGALFNGKAVLFVRPLSASAPRLLAGTEGARFPFWSPDSRWIAFFADEKLKNVEWTGGAPDVIADAADGRGGAWNAAGTILFGRRDGPLQQISPDGKVIAATTLAGRFRTHRWPRFLPDGRHFLFLAGIAGDENPENEITLGSLDAPGAGRPLVKASSQPLYYDGRLLFVRDQVLNAQSLNPKKGTLEGEPFALEEPEIAYDALLSRGLVSIADNGTLLYQAGQIARESSLTWFDRKGKALGSLGPPAPYGLLHISPDANTIAYALRRAPREGLWLADVKSGVRTRATFAGSDNWPVWSSDGRRIAFTSFNGAVSTLFIWDRESGIATPLISSNAAKWPGSWSRDGELLFYSERESKGGVDLRYITLSDRKSHVYLSTPHDETMARISPDGHWVAYMSYESGSWQIYIAPFPFTGPKWFVPMTEATMPVWRSDGKELFFMTATTVYAVAVTTGRTVTLGDPKPLFAVRPGTAAPYGFDVTGDGQRFLINSVVGQPPPPAPLTLVQNFDIEMRRLESNRR